MAAVLDVAAVDIGRDVKQTRKCFGEPLPRHDDLNVHRGTERDTLLQVPHRILRQVAQDTRGLVDQNENPFPSSLQLRRVDGFSQKRGYKFAQSHDWPDPMG